MFNPKYRKGQHKESKEARRARNKAAKKKKFDPEASETTREEKIRLENEEYEVESSDDEMDNDQIEDKHEEEDVDMDTSASTSKSLSTVPTPLNPNQSRIEELRAKLRAKLEEKRSQRPGPSGNSDTMVSKRAARRAEKQRKIELAKKNASRGSTQTG